DPAPTPIYTLSLHDALPIWFFPLMVEVGAVYVTDYLYPCAGCGRGIDTHSYRHAVLSDGMVFVGLEVEFDQILGAATADQKIDRSEEHTSELQSRENLVCRL